MVTEQGMCVMELAAYLSPSAQWLEMRRLEIARLERMLEEDA